MLKCFNMEGCKDKYTSLPHRTYLTSADCPKTPTRGKSKPTTLLGITHVRCVWNTARLAFAVNSCAQFMQNPGPSHFEADKPILCYFKTTKEAKLT